MFLPDWSIFEALWGSYVIETKFSSRFIGNEAFETISPTELGINYFF